MTTKTTQQQVAAEFQRPVPPDKPDEETDPAEMITISQASTPLLRISKWVAGVVVMIVLLFIAIIGYVAVGTYQTVHSHNTEISATYHLQKEANQNHNGTLLYLSALCAATPGCPEKLAQLEAAAASSKP